ncbi:MAG: thiamine pyrophosphate-binding protein [Thermodesulfobacteriota bacterium]|nr:thiamine pyrophosphate-binding protein [Thermodesulfobacteriota bacterium]
MQTLLGADLIVETLAREGISYVFTLPGGQMNPVHFAVDEKPGMELILPRQEGAGALMAAGYAMASGKPACIMTTVGAGIAYEIGALYLAWKERLPLISISPQVQSHKMKPIQENLQACDQDEIFKPITKFNAICYHRDRIPNLIRRALKMALAPEYGPVHLDVPVDVIYGFKMVSDKKMKNLFPGTASRFSGNIMPDPAGVETAASLIANAERPLVLAGRNVERARAGEHLDSFLRMTGFPAIPSAAAFGAVKDSDLNLGACELWHHPENRQMLAQTDLVLLLEADETTARMAQALKLINPEIPVIQTAELAASVGALVPLTAGLVGSPGAVFDALCRSLQVASQSLAVTDRWKAALLQTFSNIIQGMPDNPDIATAGKDTFYGILHTINRINNLITSNDKIVCEGRAAAMAAMAYLKRPGLHNCHILVDDDIPGAGYPVSLGVKLAAPDARVFLISETDLFKRHHRELQTQKRYRLNTTSLLFKSRETRPDHEVDFVTLAKSLGVSAQSLTDPEEEITDTLLCEGEQCLTGMLFDATA